MQKELFFFRHLVALQEILPFLALSTLAKMFYLLAIETTHPPTNGVLGVNPRVAEFHSPTRPWPRLLFDNRIRDDPTQGKASLMGKRGNLGKAQAK